MKVYAMALTANFSVIVCQIVFIFGTMLAYGLWITIYGSHMFFHALTFARSRGSCLNMRLLGRVFKHRPRDPASVNAMKQTCVIVILAYFT